MIALHSGWIDAKPSSPRSTRSRGSETTASFTGKPKEIIQRQHRQIGSCEQSLFHNGAEVEIGHGQRCPPYRVSTMPSAAFRVTEVTA